MPSDKSLLEMRRAMYGSYPEGYLMTFTHAAQVADRLVAEAVTEERQRILDELLALADAWNHYEVSGAATHFGAIVNGTDQQ